MTTFLALYRGSSVGASRLIALTAEPSLGADFAARMLQLPDGEEKDAVLQKMDQGRRRALQLVSLMEIAPMALDFLTPEERRCFYKMLSLRVIAHPDRQLEVEFGDGLSICERERVQGRCSARAA